MLQPSLKYAAGGYDPSASLGYSDRQGMCLSKLSKPMSSTSANLAYDKVTDTDIP